VQTLAKSPERITKYTQDYCVKYASCKLQLVGSIVQMVRFNTSYNPTPYLRNEDKTQQARISP
jgi:hypothetical protein